MNRSNMAPGERRGGGPAAFVRFALLVALGLGLVVPAARPVFAQDAAPPTAEAVLEKAVEALGGRAAAALHRTRLDNGTMEILPMGIKASLSIWHERPNRMAMEAEAPQLGKLAAGCDGETCWENSAMQGPRIKHGEERAQTLREADFDGLANWRTWFAKVECAGADTAAGRSAWKLLLTPKESGVETWWFDRETGRPIKQAQTINSEMGAIPVEIYPGDYRSVDGVLIPFRSLQVLMGGVQSMVLTLERVTHDVEMPAGRFDLPPDVQALKAKAAAKTTAPPPAAGK